MGDFRYGFGWLLLGMLGAVTAGAAALGVAQSPTSAALPDAVANTIAAPNYREVATEQTPQGSETAYLTYQAPDRLGGYIDSGGRRTYVYFIGRTQYQSVTVSTKTKSTKKLTFYRQPVAGASVADPVHSYLRLSSQGVDKKLSGNTTTMTLNQAGQSVELRYTVSGQYVSMFEGSGQGATVAIVISQVGTTPPVKLPSGIKIVATPGNG